MFQGFSGEIREPEVGVGELEPAQRTYFFENKKGKRIEVTEIEASALYEKKFKLLGVSDGTIFRKAVEEAHQLVKDGKPEEARKRIVEAKEEEFKAAEGNIIVPSSNKFIGNSQELMSKFNMSI